MNSKEKTAPVVDSRANDNLRDREHTVKPIDPLRNQTLVRGHIPALDGVRGLAILMVLLLHFVGNTVPTNTFENFIVMVTNYGVYGVDLFFVLSGFLITGILYDSRTKPRYFRTFYMRRVLRIFPLYYGVLIALFLIAPHIGALQSTSFDELREHQIWVWLYGVNIYNGMQGVYSLPYIDHFWSLSVEEHFYFVWPLIVWMFAKRPRTLMRVSLLVALGALVSRIAASVAEVSPISIFVLTPFRLDALCLGGFLAIFARQPNGIAQLTRWVAPGAAIAGVALVGAFAWNQFTEAGVEVLRPLRSSIILLLLALILLRALTSPGATHSSRFFRSAPMVFLGKYSYGLYVFHHFISYYLMTHRTEFLLAEQLGSHFAAVALQATLGMAASILVAYLSYELFEKHFLSLKPGSRSSVSHSSESRTEARVSYSSAKDRSGPAQCEETTPATQLRPFRLAEDSGGRGGGVS